MRLNKIIILILLLQTPTVSFYAVGQADTLKPQKEKVLRISSPTKATMLAAAFPGMGQVYNRKYWKIPVVYAGFGALGYSIIKNSQNYTQFLEAYRDLTDIIPATTSYTEILSAYNPEEYDPALESPLYDPSTNSWIKDQLMNGIDYYRRYRDLSYIGVALWYLITIMDASVEANLYDYDISEDLTVLIEPVQIPPISGSTDGLGLKVTV